MARTKDRLSDTADNINAAGTAQIASIVSAVALALDASTALTYRKVASPTPRGDMRSFNASLPCRADLVDVDPVDARRQVAQNRGTNRFPHGDYDGLVVTEHTAGAGDRSGRAVRTAAA